MIADNRAIQFDSPEVSDIKGMVSDCNCGLIVYGLSEDKLFGTMRRRKMIVFFDREDLETETVMAHANRAMQAHNVSLSKATLYKVNNGWMARCKVAFKAVLHKTIFGFTPNTETVSDNRKGGVSW